MPPSRFVKPCIRATSLGSALFASVFAIMSIGAAGSASAIVIASQGFETPADSNNWAYTISDVVGATLSASAATGSGDNPASSRILSGLSSLQAFSTGTAEGTSVITFNNVDVSLYDNLYISIRVSGTTSGTANGLDASDYMRVFVSSNGAAYASNTENASDVSLNGLTNAKWTYDATRTSTSNAGTHVGLDATAGVGTTVDPFNYSTIIINLSDLTSLVGMRINFGIAGTGEFFNVDNITLNGTLTAPEPSKAVLLMLGLGCLVVRRRRKSIFA